MRSPPLVEIVVSVVDSPNVLVSECHVKVIQITTLIIIQMDNKVKNNTNGQGEIVNYYYFTKNVVWSLLISISRDICFSTQHVQYI